MSDLISRQEAIDAVEKSRRANCHQDRKAASAHEYEHRHFLEILIDLPPAEPVRHAKNIGTDYDETDQFVCSECGIELQGWYRVERDEDDGEETYHEYRIEYCPHCGARIEQ